MKYPSDLFIFESSCYLVSYTSLALPHSNYPERNTLVVFYRVLLLPFFAIGFEMGDKALGSSVFDELRNTKILWNNYVWD
jgi:hypothetical protein